MGGILLELMRILVHVGGDQVVGDDVLQEIEPEQGELGQHAALLRDAGGQHIVEGGDAVGGDEEQMIVTDQIKVADFPAGEKLQAGKISMQEYVVVLS